MTAKKKTCKWTISSINKILYKVGCWKSNGGDVYTIKSTRNCPYCRKKIEVRK